MSAVVFYPTLADAAFPYAGIQEWHNSALLTRSLREGRNILALLDHDRGQVVGSTQDGTLRVTVERDGLRAELALPDTAAGRRLNAALAAGRVSGASFGFMPVRVRWHLGPRPIRELLDASVSELSILVSTTRPANGRTWAAALGPRLAERYKRLRARPGAAYCPPVPPRADVSLRFPPLRPTAALTASLWNRAVIARELAAARRTGARIVDIVYARPLRDLIAASARHTARVSTTSGDRPAGAAAGVKPVALPERPASGRQFFGATGTAIPLSPKGASAMHEDDALPRLRPAPGRREFPGPRSLDGFQTKIRLDDFKRRLERRLPGASRWIASFRPYVDSRGVWHANPQLLPKRRPLSLREALERMEEYREEYH